MLIDSDEVIPQLRRIAESVKRHGTPLFGQVNHGGRYARQPLTGAEPLAPSAVKDTINRVTPRAMTEEQIETAIASFVTASLRLREAGFDGVEINGTHGYLVNQFLSGFTNRRTDRWGGARENRLLFLSEIVSRTRAAAGPGFPVTVKLSGSDFMPRGITLEECVFFSRRLESLGVSGLTISGGFKEKAFRTMSKGDIPRQLVLANRRGVERILGMVLLAGMRRSARFSEGYFLPHAAAVKAAVSIPVTTVGGFRTLAVMEKALADGAADLVGLSRPLIREPLPAPAPAGRERRGRDVRELQPVHRDDRAAFRAAALSLEEGDRAGIGGRRRDGQRCLSWTAFLRRASRPPTAWRSSTERRSRPARAAPSSSSTG